MSVARANSTDSGCATNALANYSYDAFSRRTNLSYGLLGIIIGLWANNFEQLTILNVFFIAPLSFVGGIFNTVNMLPGWLRWMAYGNPFFYFINGLRHSMIGFSEASELLGFGVALALAAIISVIVWRLYATGYGLRE